MSGKWFSKTEFLLLVSNFQIKLNLLTFSTVKKKKKEFEIHMSSEIFKAPEQKPTSPMQ